MNCNHCGQEIEIDSKFCRFCGKPYEREKFTKKRHKKTFRDHFPVGRSGTVLYCLTISLFVLIILGIIAGIGWLIYEYGAILFFIVFCGVPWLIAALIQGGNVK